MLPKPKIPLCPLLASRYCYCPFVSGYCYSPSPLSQPYPPPFYRVHPPKKASSYCIYSQCAVHIVVGPCAKGHFIHAGLPDPEFFFFFFLDFLQGLPVVEGPDGVPISVHEFSRFCVSVATFWPWTPVMKNALPGTFAKRRRSLTWDVRGRVQRPGCAVLCVIASAAQCTAGKKSPESWECDKILVSEAQSWCWISMTRVL